uniref:RING-type E3 ubiquitin transferase n=1 Tax=Meloidogyne enterolobii TaxID=390850 RepID=A0A6V7W0K8_MELEN|nr:unnamed protein product [Meloidogyne enterolobii]
MSDKGTPIVAPDGSMIVQRDPNKIASSGDHDPVYDKLEHAFGVSTATNGTLSAEFDSSAELIMKLQNMLRSIELSLDKVSLSFAFDEVIMEAVNSIKPPRNSMDASDLLAETYINPLFKSCLNKAASSAFDYLIGLYGRCNSLVNQSHLGLSAKIFSTLSERAKVQFILFLRGLLCANKNSSYQDISTVFTKFMLTNLESISPFLRDIIVCCKDVALTDESALIEVFGPVLDIIRSCAIHINMTKLFEDKHYSLLLILLEIKMSDNIRPIADLIVSRPDFHPKHLITNFKGREFVHSSFLGPFIAFSIAGSQSPLYEFCFDHNDVLFDYSDMENKELKINEFQTQLRMMRIKMHQIFHALIVNSSTRNRTLGYISEILDTNKKLSQIQVEYEQLANPTAMLNMLSILLDFDKIPVEKIQDDYIFHPKCRIKMSEINTLKMDSDMIEAYRKKIDLSYTPSFNTECFYLTIAFMGISMTTMMNNLSRMDRHIYEIRRQLRDAEEQLQRKGQNPSQLNRIRAITQRTKELLKRFTLSNVCYDCLINDQNLLSKCSNFVNKLLRLFLRSVMPDSGVDYRSFTPCIERFASLPEAFLETGIEFLHFLLEHPQRSKVLLLNVSDYPRLILNLIVNLPHIKNPFLASKIVDLFFFTCPDVSSDAGFFFRQIMNDKIAVDNLFPALVKFYADVESTGSNTEFYDKFNIRRNIQVIFRSMWMDLAHRKRMVQFAEESSPDFYRFLNMVINDTTFLLDESLEKLKRINEIETQMSNEVGWNSLREEERQHRSELLGDAKRQVRIWLRFGTETMELFVTLTGDAPQIFLQEALGDRVAAMLNNNIVQLCGPKCSQLKVQDAKKRFNWDPRNHFAKQIAQDERSYTPDTFDSILKRFEEKSILPVSQFESFKNLVEQAKEAHNEKVKFEEKFEDEIPDEFRDEILFTLMSDPVTLPSGQVVDRKNILRHLLSDPHNPFTRQPLTEDELKPNIELKARITSWVNEKKSEINKKGAANNKS